MFLDINKNKKARLLHYARDKVYNIYHRFIDERIGRRQLISSMAVPVEYKRIKHALTKYFTPKKHFLLNIKILTDTTKPRRQYGCILDQTTNSGTELQVSQCWKVTEIEK